MKSVFLNSENMINKDQYEKDHKKAAFSPP